VNVSVEVTLVDLCCERFDVEIAIQSNDDYCRRLVMLCNCLSPDTIRYDRPTRSYFNVRSKDDMSQLNLPHGNDN